MFDNFTKIENTFYLSNNSAKVHVMPVNFTDIDVHDDRFKHIKVILLMTECSRSAVTNPVDFIVSEGEGGFS